MASPAWARDSVGHVVVNTCVYWTEIECTWVPIVAIGVLFALRLLSNTFATLTGAIWAGRPIGDRIKNTQSIWTDVFRTS